MKYPLVTALALLALVSCEKPNHGAEQKLRKLEQKAAEAVERQKQLELELAQQRLMAERDAVERERTLMELERSNREQDALAEQDERQRELLERERRLLDLEKNLDDRREELSGLENELSEKELKIAGREPLPSLPLEERRPTNTRVGDYRYFYDSLASYGSWFHTQDYGYVFQPVVVRERSWRPYTRGRWVFTNHGWTWVSSEPFGWACYHYGRWALLKNTGWVWIPGNQWAPAWVTWRESPGYIGWAPLPPETLVWRTHSWSSSVDTMFSISSHWYSFVSYRHFGSYVQSHCLPISQNTLIYQNTANTTHYLTIRERVFLGGPSYQTACERVGRRLPIHRVRRDETTDWSRRGATLSSRIERNELVVIAPTLDEKSGQTFRPDRVNRDLGVVMVDRNQDLPKEVREEYRSRESRFPRAATKATSSNREPDAGDRSPVLADRVEPGVKQNHLAEVPETRNEKPTAVEIPQQPIAEERNIGSRPAPATGRKERPEKSNRDTAARPETEIVGNGTQEVESVKEKPAVPTADRRRVEPDSSKRTELPPGVFRPGDGNEIAKDREIKIDGDSGRSERPVEPEIANPYPERRTEPEIANPYPQRDVLLEGRREAGRQENERGSAEKESALEQNQRESQALRQREQEERAIEQQKLEQERVREAEARRIRAEQLQQDEMSKRQEQESVRREREEQETARRQQSEMLREQAEIKRQQEEQAVRQEEAMKRQQEEAQRQREEQMRQQEEARQQQEAQAQARRQQEEMARQQEQARQQQEEMRRQQEEQARRQQEEMARQQQEEVRRQQEEQVRRQQEEAQRQQEEMRRQQQEQMERARQQQEPRQ